MINGIGINVPQDVVGAGYVEKLAGFAEAAVANGYDSLWVSESLKPDVADPLAVLNFLAARTSDVRLGVAVLIAGLRSPLRLAREVASLDQLSAGRAIVGVGVGNDRAEYARHGIEPGHRGRHFEDGIRIVKPFNRMRKIRNDSEYPTGKAPGVTADDVREDIPRVDEIIEMAVRVIDQMDPF